MNLVEGIHHATWLTEDIDRLTAFYERVFDASKTLDMTEEGVRHVYLEVGPTTVVHPFQFLDGPTLPPAPGTMFERGRLDHFALWATSKEAFVEIRRRVEAEGASDGDARDMTTMWIMGLNDPDGFYVEGDLAQARRAGLKDVPTGELDHRRTGLILAEISHRGDRPPLGRLAASRAWEESR